ncbi:MAG: amidoligase family protein, partial [Anaeroplasmataceae bacterium]
NEDNDMIYICKEHHKKLYILCSNCHDYSLADSEYCTSCEQTLIPERIQNFNYKPYEYKFFNDDGTYDTKPIKDTLYMGIELEVELAYDNHEDDYDLANSINRNTVEYLDQDHQYFKEDGSVEYGFEIVTYPCTKNYHLTTLPKTLRILNEQDYESDDVYEGASFHIHVNKCFFGDKEAIEIANSKLVIFFEKFWTELVELSRRTDNQLHWCLRPTAETEESICKGKNETMEDLKYNLKSVLNKSKEYNITSRYRAINSTKNTFEFRLWRGTLQMSKAHATMLLTESICNMVKVTSIEDIINKSFKELIPNIETIRTLMWE